MIVLVVLLANAALVIAATTTPYTYEGQNTWYRTYPKCGGKSQSPVDIDTSQVLNKTNAPPMKFSGYDKNINSKNLILVNTGHFLKLQLNSPPKTAPFVRGGVLPGTFYFHSIHFNWGLDASYNEGSEHTVNGEHFAVEASVLHLNLKYPNFAEALKHPDGMVIFTVFINLNPLFDESSLAPILGALPLSKVIKPNVEVHLPGNLTIESLFPIDGNWPYYTYPGSFTHPPCYEGVTRILYIDPLFCTTSEWTNLHKLADLKGKPISKNTRKIQSLGSRSIYYVDAN